MARVCRKSSTLHSTNLPTDLRNATGYGKSCDTVQDLRLHPAGTRKECYHEVTLTAILLFVARQIGPHHLLRT